MDTTRTVDIPVDLVPFFEAALRQKGVGAGVTYHDDGSRSYHVDPQAWDESSIIRAAEESVERLRVALQSRAEVRVAG